MSNGDDEEAADPDTEEQSEEPGAADASDGDVAAEGSDPGDAEPEAEAAANSADAEAEDEGPVLDLSDPDEIEERLDSIEADIDTAETEVDLDAVETELDAVAAALADADLPEPDDDEEEDPHEELESRVEEIRGTLEEARGPYAEDVVEAIESAQSTARDSEWTEGGEVTVTAAIETYLSDVGEIVNGQFTVDGDDVTAAAAALDDVSAAVEDAGLDPDDDAEMIERLLERTDALLDELENAETWDDLSIRQKLEADGFFDRLNSRNRKDFPPELSVVRIAEQENDPERILMALNYLESDFTEEFCIDALRRMGPPEAYDAMMDRAQKRDRPAIEVLGKIGDERALDTLHEFIEGEGNPPLQKVTLKAIGEIGSEASTQPVADRLVAEDPEVRSRAARALGRIGDTRAVAPLSVALADDDSDNVRAAAAWALYQIGTERALEEAADYTEDRSYIVQHEAEKAAEALEADPATA